MDFPAYGARWRARAFADTREFWTPTKIVLQIAGPVVAGIAWAVFKPWGGWWPIVQIAVISILGFLALWGVAYMAQLCLAPGKIHAEQQASIALLNETISVLNAQPKISEMEQAQRHLVAEKLATFLGPEIEALRYVLHHGRTHNIRLVEQFGDTVAETASRKAIIAGLINQAMPYYEINPPFESALIDYFTRDRPVKPPSG